MPWASAAVVCTTNPAVLVPSVLMELVLKVAVAPDGTPVTAKLTVLVPNSSSVTTVTVE